MVILLFFWLIFSGQFIQKSACGLTVWGYETVTDPNSKYMNIFEKKHKNKQKQKTTTNKQKTTHKQTNKNPSVFLLDTVTLSFLAFFLFCYFIFPEKEITAFQPCFFLPPIHSQFLPCTFTAWTIVYTSCSLSLNYFQHYFLFNDDS